MNVTMEVTDQHGMTHPPSTVDLDLMLGLVTFGVAIAEGPFSVRFTPVADALSRKQPQQEGF